ncbi:uncharacterized protein LOC123679640 [Harmonia axyridis]|uniref:uncharacterized protein LOC123679640 n=1 Tax=Harmonia axyridis TaxID=115357 RepID=UPI001E2768CF|nr:uncharacterized protein LOC123679640 [Harmonia axyridis]
MINFFVNANAFYQQSISRKRLDLYQTKFTIYRINVSELMMLSERNVYKILVPVKRSLKYNTMKLLLILLISGHTIAYSHWYKEVESLGQIQAFIGTSLSPDTYRCSQSIYRNIKKEELKAIECLKNLRYNSSLCNHFVYHFKPCLEALLAENKKCDNEDSFNLKMIVLDSIIAEAKFVCETDGEHILEIFNPCIVHSAKKSKECIKNILTPSSHFSRNITLFCSKFPNMWECFDAQLQHECQNDITKNTMLKLFSDGPPCNILSILYMEIASNVQIRNITEIISKKQY